MDQWCLDKHEVCGMIWYCTSYIMHSHTCMHTHTCTYTLHTRTGCPPPPRHTQTYTTYQNMTLTCAHTQTYVHTHTRCIHVPKQDAYMCTHIHTRAKEEYSCVLKAILIHNTGRLHMHTHTHMHQGRTQSCAENNINTQHKISHNIHSRLQQN